MTTPVATSATSAADLFTFVDPGPPATVTGVSPTSGPNTGGTIVVISGTGLAGATGVSFGSVPASFTLDLATGDLKATSPAEGLGVVDVTVTTPNGVSATGPGDQFTFTRPQVPPTLSSLSAHSGPATGGKKVTIHGLGFTGATAVKFGAVPAAFVVNSNTSITATSPVEAVGTVDITVTTPNGTTAVTPADQFKFKAPH